MLPNFVISKKVKKHLDLDLDRKLICLEMYSTNQYPADRQTNDSENITFLVTFLLS